MKQSVRSWTLLAVLYTVALLSLQSGRAGPVNEDSHVVGSNTLNILTTTTMFGPGDQQRMERLPEDEDEGTGWKVRVDELIPKLKKAGGLYQDRQQSVVSVSTDLWSMDSTRFFLLLGMVAVGTTFADKVITLTHKKYDEAGTGRSS